MRQISRWISENEFFPRSRSFNELHLEIEFGRLFSSLSVALSILRLINFPISSGNF